LGPLGNDGTPWREAGDPGRPLSRVIDALTADLSHPPSLEDLAREAGMSHARLNRCFRRAYGTTVFAWLRDHRLERACHHLRQDAHSITEIAFLCGFSSSSHFAAAFRERHGCSPARYRRQDPPGTREEETGEEA
ncbi:AraC family transcriptional regulator, partial [Candidatus Falkowbacteria bacterium]|nr:AraC family transcriptional regulator [Candidatus Falkowbacteria bacterium]